MTLPRTLTADYTPPPAMPFFAYFGRKVMQPTASGREC